jgi:anti-anti-sigma factor
MEWTTESLPDGIERIILAGRMDSAGTQQVDPRFVALTGTGPALIVVDLAQVPFLASVGIRTLIANAKALALHGGRMVLAGPQPMVGTVLKYAGIDGLIPVYESVATACAALRRPASSL